MNIVLYYAPNACSLVPYVTLTEANAKFEVRPLNMRKDEHKSADYLKINPKHKVPLLVIDGQTLSENTAMHLWMSRTFPLAKLMPSDPWQEAKAISLMSWCASGIHPFLSRINSPSRVCDVANSTDSVVKFAQENLFESFKIADDLLAGREYFFDHFTAPDAHFFWCLRRAQQLKVDTSRFANCMAHFARMNKRPSVQKLVAYETSVLDAFAKAA